jgi:hypothetical protein
MNGQIIRYLALNGPSLIYSVAKDLASLSQTKVHYPTVNRRMHELVCREYLQKAGTRTTKAGVPADLYATTIRGDFAALAGVLDVDGENAAMSPKEVRQVIANASLIEGSPFVLLAHLLGEGQSATELVDKELVPEIVNCVRNGYLNLDALDEGVICSAFASLISRKLAAIIATLSRDHSAGSREKHRGYVDILMRSLEKSMTSSLHKVDKARRLQDARVLQKLHLAPISSQWGTELKVFLKLHSVRFE